VIGVPFLLAVILLLPSFWWALVVALISAMAAYELLRCAGEGKLTLPMELVSLLSALALPLSVWYGQGAMTAGICGFVVLAVCFWCAIRAYDEGGAPIGLSHVLLSAFAGCAIPLGLSALVVLRGMECGRCLVLLALLLTFVTDGAAYFGGVFLGRHRGVTRVSPKKSVEGYLCGFAAGAVFAVLCGLAVSAVEGNDVRLLPLALCGLLGALTTELGDLIFSLIKRQYGVKDYGHVLPGHGGMLDRFDSMIVSAPVVLFIVYYFPVFQ
jgi:phosphatidate cytidylyltransferase